MPSQQNQKPARRLPKGAPILPPPDHRAIRAAQLDRVADFELHLGHHLAAERLAWRAAQLREVAR